MHITKVISLIGGVLFACLSGVAMATDLTGQIDAVSPLVISGWAKDLDNPSAHVEVHVYYGGPSSGGGTFAGFAVADQSHATENGHGFSYTFTSANLKAMYGSPDGVDVYAYAVYGGSDDEIFPTTGLETKPMPHELVLDLSDMVRVGCSLQVGATINQIQYRESTSQPWSETPNWVMDTLHKGFPNEILDPGLEIQTSLYQECPDGEACYTQGATGCDYYRPWAWNPVQGGDQFGRGSQICDASVTSSEIYTKLHPLRWSPLETEEDCEEDPVVLEDVTYEQWIRKEKEVAGDGALFSVRWRIEYDGMTDFGPALQETPVLFLTDELPELSTYFGSDPWNATMENVTFDMPSDCEDGCMGRTTAAWIAWHRDTTNREGILLAKSIGTEFVTKWHTWPTMDDCEGQPPGCVDVDPAYSYTRFQHFVPINTGANNVIDFTVYFYVGGLDAGIEEAEDLFLDRDAWEFATAGDLEGWRKKGTVAEPLDVTGGSLVATITGSAPVLEAAATGFGAWRFGQVAVRMKVPAFSPGGGDSPKLNLYFVRDPMAQNAASDVLSTDLETDGAFHTYVFDVRSSSEWASIIRKLALGLDDGPGSGDWEVDYVRLLDDGVIMWDWTVDGERETWSASSDIDHPIVENGLLELHVDSYTNNVSHILSRERTPVDLSDYDAVRIRMSSSHSGTANVRFTTFDEVTGMGEVPFPTTQKVDFAVSGGGTLNEYVVDMFENANWDGELWRLVIFMPNCSSCTDADFDIDWIEIVKRYGIRWEFASTSEGWTGTNTSVSQQSAQGGVLEALYNPAMGAGSPQKVISPDAVGVDAAFGVLRFELEASPVPAQSTVTVEFLTDSDGTWDAAKSKTFNLVPSVGYHSYAVDMSAVAAWDGEIRRLRFSTAFPTSGGSVRLRFKHIRLATD